MKTLIKIINRVTAGSILAGMILIMYSSIVHAAPDNSLIEELSQKVDAMGREINDLRGENEKLNHELEQLKSNQKKGFLAIDERFEKRQPAPKPKPQKVAPAKPIKAAPVVAQKPVVKPSPTKPVSAKKTAPAKPVVSGANGVKAEYNHAYQTLKGNRQAGINRFTEFLKKYPAHPLAENAHYWIGEAKYAKKDYKGAIDSFVVVLNKYKAGRKAPDAAVKLGYSFYALKDWTLSRRTFNDVLRYFPGSNAAKLAQARLDRMQKEGH